jgi:hypothetical protein
MLKFLGFDLELSVEFVVSRAEWPDVYCARDFVGERWIIVQVDDDPARLAWLCAPASDRAVQAIVNGQATPVDLVRHSRTGTVELVALEGGRAVPERCLLCSSLPEELLPTPRVEFHAWPLAS